MNRCHEFLQHILPKLGYRWPGFRKVRRQVCRRIHQRMQELEINNYSDYLVHIDRFPGELGTIDGFLDITISRFWRDRGVFELLEKIILPDLLAKAKQDQRNSIRCWCAGCCNGEEPYSLALLWHLRLSPGNMQFHITATDRNDTVLKRAASGIFPGGALKDLPQDLLEKGFDTVNNGYAIKRKYAGGIQFRQQDIRRDIPDGLFDMIFCRNFIFTYYEHSVRDALFRTILARLRPGGYLVIGAHEHLPHTDLDIRQVKEGEPVYCKQSPHPS